MNKSYPIPIHKLIEKKNINTNTNLIKLKKKAFIIKKINKNIKKFIPKYIKLDYRIIKINKNILILETNSINWKLHLTSEKKKLLNKLKYIIPSILNITIKINKNFQKTKNFLNKDDNKIKNIKNLKLKKKNLSKKSAEYINNITKYSEKKLKNIIKRFIKLAN